MRLPKYFLIGLSLALLAGCGSSTDLDTTDPASPDARPDAPSVLPDGSPADQAADSMLDAAAEVADDGPAEAQPDVQAEDAPEPPPDGPPDVLVCSGAESACDGKCVDLAKDDQHCGKCGNACAFDQVCSGGVCALGCFGGTQACQQGATTVCANLGSDPLHCGACGKACAAGQVCSQGVCTVSCQPGLAECSGKCVNPASDPANCGACGTACAAGQVCAAGTCALVCPPGTTDCGGACTILDFDPGSCGACGNVCPGAPNATAVCSGGTCALLCGEQFQNCNMSTVDGCEVNVAGDPLNCGACGQSCPAAPHAAPACASFACGLSCETGWGNCDSYPDNGCEADLGADPLHCSQCGKACPAGPHSQGVCTSGSCSIACDAGFSNCNGSSLDGCETSTQTDPQNCGACAKACSKNHATPSCAGGVCSIAACDKNWGDCNKNAADGCETDLLSSKNNCGSCGHACYLFCYNGFCI